MAQHGEDLASSIADLVEAKIYGNQFGGVNKAFRNKTQLIVRSFEMCETYA